MTAGSVRAAGSSPARGRRLALGVLLCVAFLAFVALGTWQVERRAWKLALIERVGQRIAAPPVSAPGRDQWADVSRQTDEYHHVRLTGRYVRGAETFVQAVTERGAGFWVLTPLRTTDGSIVLVNRGFVSTATPRAARTNANDDPPISVTGLLRLTEPGGGFLRHNDPAADRWYSRDVDAIARARALGRVAPYFVDADSPPASAPQRPDEPVGGLTVVHFSNSHLVYAITWYVLALLSAVAGWQLVREGREPPSPPEQG